MIKHKDVDESEAFQGYESSLKSVFIDIYNSCDNMFQEYNMFPLKRGKKYEVQLHHNASLLNIGVTKMSMLESAKFKEKMQKKIEFIYNLCLY